MSAADMMELLAGYAGAHGTHGATDVRSGSLKKEIKSTARTVREPVTLQLWEDHIAGRRPIGIITIREDRTCMWGAIDVDRYDIVHTELVHRLAGLGVPCVVCRTKSGGAHVYLFFSEPIVASEVISKLRELASAIGEGGSEIFPKQASFLEEKGELGNWLNMPYFGGDRTDRYAVSDSGRGLSLQEFVAAARRVRLTKAQFASLSLYRPVAEFSKGPPCLEQLSAIGIGEGSRNNGLMALAVLARKMQPDSWGELMLDWNKQFVRPPVPTTEVQALVRRLEKKDYSYQCRSQPIVSYCNVTVCRTREFGVGMAGVDCALESISVLDTEPPLFFVSMRVGGTVECDASTLLSPRDFQRAALAQLRVVLPLYKLDSWLRDVQLCMEKATLIEAPREVGITGRFEEILDRFCTDRHAADSLEDCLLGKPFLDEKLGRVWFRLQDLQEILERHKFRELTRGQITTRIKKLGGDTKFKNLRGKGVNLWWIPKEKVQWATSSSDLPASAEEPL